MKSCLFKHLDRTSVSTTARNFWTPLQDRVAFKCWRACARARVSEIIETEYPDEYIIELATKLVENRSNSIVLDRDEYQATVEEREALRLQKELNEKRLWLLGETDRDFANKMSEKLDEFSMSQLKALFSVYQDMRSRVSSLQGVVGEDDLLDRETDIRENVRELIFGRRRDAKPIGKIRDIQDVK